MGWRFLCHGMGGRRSGAPALAPFQDHYDNLYIVVTGAKGEHAWPCCRCLWSCCCCCRPPHEIDWWWAATARHQRLPDTQGGGCCSELPTGPALPPPPPPKTHSNGHTTRRCLCAVFHLLPYSDCYRMAMRAYPAATYERNAQGQLVPVLKQPAQEVMWCPVDPAPSGAQRARGSPVCPACRSRPRSGSLAG